MFYPTCGLHLLASGLQRGTNHQSDLPRPPLLLGLIAVHRATTGGGSSFQAFYRRGDPASVRPLPPRRCRTALPLCALPVVRLLPRVSGVWTPDPNPAFSTVVVVWNPSHVVSAEPERSVVAYAASVPGSQPAMIVAGSEIVHCRLAAFCFLLFTFPRFVLFANENISVSGSHRLSMTITAHS